MKNYFNIRMCVYLALALFLVACAAGPEIPQTARQEANKSKETKDDAQFFANITSDQNEHGDSIGIVEPSPGYYPHETSDFNRFGR